jgi:hypothetical protein
MLDDALAGLYSLAALQGIVYLTGIWAGEVPAVQMN